MQFHSRSLQDVLDDLIRKLAELPPGHPSRCVLTRMAGGLRELELRKTQEVQKSCSRTGASE